MTPSGQEWQFHIATDTYSQEWKFHTAIDTYRSRMAIQHCYCYLVVKNDNFTLLLISSGQEWQFHTATDTYRSRMAISHCY